MAYFLCLLEVRVCALFQTFPSFLTAPAIAETAIWWYNVYEGRVG